jgi:hypothetical protein
MRKFSFLIFISILSITVRGHAQDKVDTSGIFTGTPDSLPHFKNYPKGWYFFLERNLNAQTPVDNGAKPGRYEPVISFIVNEDGSLSDFTIKTDGGYKTGEEALRLMKLSPPWVPAMYQGHPVKYGFEQKIAFQVTSF